MGRCRCVKSSSRSSCGAVVFWRARAVEARTVTFSFRSLPGNCFCSSDTSNLYTTVSSLFVWSFVLLFFPFLLKPASILRTATPVSFQRTIHLREPHLRPNSSSVPRRFFGRLLLLPTCCCFSPLSWWCERSYTPLYFTRFSRRLLLLAASSR